MSLSLRIKEFFYSLNAPDKYSDYDSRKSFNRINKPSAETSLLSHHNNASSVSLTGSVSNAAVGDGVHEMRLAWRHIKKWLHKHSSDLNDLLLTPCTTADLNELQKDLGVRLPQCVTEFFLLTDGQSSFDDNGAGGLIYGLKLLSIDQIAVLTESWRKANQSLIARNMATTLKDTEQDADATLTSLEGDLGTGLPERKPTLLTSMPEQHSVPPGAIYPKYVDDMWIPIITDGAGNSIALDLLPASEEGESTHLQSGLSGAVWGQVIVFGRDFDTKFKIADNFGDFMLMFAKDLEQGNWDLRTTLDNQDMVCGVDSELVYVDHVTKKEQPYLDVLRERCVKNWIDSLTEEERKLKSNRTLIEHLCSAFSYHVPNVSDRRTDDFISENLAAIDGTTDGDD